MKIPAEFAPKSWEMPPGFRVLEESASVVTREFDGEKLDWLVALVEVPAHKIAPIFWMRPMDARFDAGFVSYGNADYALLTLSHKVEAFALRASLSNIWKNKEVARLFLLNQNGELRKNDEAPHESLLVASGGMAAWNQSGISNPHRGTVLFDFAAPLSNNEFLRIPAFEIWKRLDSTRDLDTFYSRQFAQLSEKECSSLVFDFTRGTDKEVESWLRTILLKQDVWGEPALGEKLFLQSSALNDLQLFWDDDYDDYYGEPMSVKPELEADVALVRNWFFQINQEISHYSCVRQWLRHNEPRFNVSIKRPTAHEQLEAALRWRQWKENHQKL